MTLYAKDYGLAEALCGKPEIVVVLDMAIQCHKENIPRTSRLAMNARATALSHYHKMRRRLDAAEARLQLRKTHGS